MRSTGAKDIFTYITRILLAKTWCAVSFGDTFRILTREGSATLIPHRTHVPGHTYTIATIVIVGGTLPPKNTVTIAAVVVPRHTSTKGHTRPIATIVISRNASTIGHATPIATIVETLGAKASELDASTVTGRLLTGQA